MLMYPTLTLPTLIIMPAFLAYGILQVQRSETWILPFTSHSLNYSIPVRILCIVFSEMLIHTTGGGEGNFINYGTMLMDSKYCLLVALQTLLPSTVTVARILFSTPLMRLFNTFLLRFDSLVPFHIPSWCPLTSSKILF